ncbi:MAG: 2-phospho-L-lactate transferase [Halioglobus sp.]|nr:2-phospho-L-lactate transferase [Halioglobus sp.]
MQKSVLALSGGVGGAKLALGLADSVAAGQLHVLANTGDDFKHLGLHISPDIDTLLYTLSGKSNESLGWGLADETWTVMAALEQLQGETWFRLGDNDLATHLWRTAQLADGVSLLDVTGKLAAQLGIVSHIHPMCEELVSTTVHSEGRDLAFQHYFVREQCKPAVTGFSFDGIDQASPNPEVMMLLASEALSAIVVCPSNPFVSIDPILQIPRMWTALRDCAAPLVLVSPIVSGMAIKGPAAKMMVELGMPVTALGVAQHYCDLYPDLLDYFVIDETDAKLVDEIAKLGVNVAIAPTVMTSRDDKKRLARFILDLVE